MEGWVPEHQGRQPAGQGLVPNRVSTTEQIVCIQTKMIPVKIIES